MGWNDHDDRLMMIADAFESAGMDYDAAYAKALDIRTDEMLSGEFADFESMANDYAWGAEYV